MSKSTDFEPFACDLCFRGLVIMQTGRGRTRAYKANLVLPIPDDYEMATCTSCGETYVSLEESRELDEIQSHELLKQGVDLSGASEAGDSS